MSGIVNVTIDDHDRGQGIGAAGTSGTATTLDIAAQQHFDGHAEHHRPECLVSVSQQSGQVGRGTDVNPIVSS